MKRKAVGEVGVLRSTRQKFDVDKNLLDNDCEEVMMIPLIDRPRHVCHVLDKRGVTWELISNSVRFQTLMQRNHGTGFLEAFELARECGNQIDCSSNYTSTGDNPLVVFMKHPLPLHFDLNLLSKLLDLILNTGGRDLLNYRNGLCPIEVGIQHQNWPVVELLCNEPTLKLHDPRAESAPLYAIRHKVPPSLCRRLVGRWMNEVLDLPTSFETMLDKFKRYELFTNFKRYPFLERFHDFISF